MISKCILDMGPGRMGEEDTIFDRKVEIIGGNSEGLWLDEGMQKFDFSIILPANPASHDWHLNAQIKHRLYGEVEGVTETESPMSSIFSFRRPSASTARKAPRSPGPGSRSRSGSPRHEVGLNSTALSVTRKEASLPQAPPYEEGSGDDWLKGSVYIDRTVTNIYNPSPSGWGSSELDERVTGELAGIALYNLRMYSDVWTICALLQARFTLAALPSTVTFFCFRIVLSQTHSITSPRDNPEEVKPLTSTRYFTSLRKVRDRLENAQHPDQNMPALWRGKDAGGRVSGDLEISSKGQLPNDDHARPSTVGGIITPIKVSHSLVTEVYFSVYGETDRSEKMSRPGPGGLRLLKISRPIILPSCLLQPQIIDLPSYETHKSDRFSNHLANAPCPVCKTTIEDRLCQVCSFTDLPHSQHDHDPAVSGEQQWDMSGVLSELNYLPTGGPSWRDCACGMDIVLMERRMKIAIKEEQLEDKMSEVTVSGKEEAERGRQR